MTCEVLFTRIGEKCVQGIALPLHPMKNLELSKLDVSFTGYCPLKKITVFEF
jgi:hypothetical protein